MSEQPWWQTGVIYQIAVPSFFDSDNDGYGDLCGVREKLDYLNDGTPNSLGVDAIWLTPITDSPLQDFGYDVRDYRSINPRFGTMHDFEELLAECHKRGIRVVFDLVLNHTSDQHPWFVESRSCRTNSKRDWYVWKNGRSFWRPPNRWRAVVEGSAWTYDVQTKQYYYHAFLPCQPDLNWRNPEVRKEMFDVARFWLDKGVDGFRLDLINFLFEDEQLRNNPLQLGWHPYGWQRHVYDRSQPETLETVRALRRLTDEYPERALIGEVYADTPEECMIYLGNGTDALHLSFYMDFATQWWRASHYRRSVAWLEAHIPPEAWPCYYLNNHDLPRTYSRLSRIGRRDADPRAKVAAAMLLTLRGTPIIYYGEELGLPTSHLPRKELHDPVGMKFWPLPFGRDGSRTPMPWTSGHNAGFTAGTPWLAVDRSHYERSVEAQLKDPESLLAWYRSLIHLRSATPALHSGTYRALPGAARGVFAYMRETATSQATVLLNFSHHKSPSFLLPPPREADTWNIALSTHRKTRTTWKGSHISLFPYEVLIVAAGP